VLQIGGALAGVLGQTYELGEEVPSGAGGRGRGAAGPGGCGGCGGVGVAAHRAPFRPYSGVRDAPGWGGDPGLERPEAVPQLPPLLPLGVPQRRRPLLGAPMERR